MTTTQTGHLAESAAASYLEERGYDVLARNWRHRTCEIDLVARKSDCLYFTEVKYRRQDGQGSGLDYITPAKLRQMSYAAEFFVARQRWNGDYALAGIEVSGPAFTVTAFVPDLW